MFFMIASFVFIIAQVLQNRNLRNPYLYLALIIPLYIPNVFYLEFYQVDYSKFGSLLFLSIVSFHIGFRVLSFIPKKRYYVSRSNNKQLSSFSLFSIFCGMTVLFLINIYIFNVSDIFKATGFLLGDIYYPFAFGFLFYFFFRHKAFFYASVVLYTIFLITLNTFAADISRFSVSIFCLFIVLLNYMGSRANTKLGVPSFIFGLAAIVTVAIFLYENNGFGGDTLIINNAVEIISHIDSYESLKYEPFMLLHNVGLFAIPDSMWPGGKPIDYNPSAWYIQNVIGMQPSLYPWGIGVTSIGAGYIYGGVAGVFGVFFVIGACYAQMLRSTEGIFLYGVSLYFLMKLPFALYRMDNTFLFSFAMISLPVIIIASKSIAKRSHAE